MSASLSGVFSLQEFTDAGLSGVGYRLYTYISGSNTFKTAYTDAAGLVPHTYTADGLGGQYIGLNARGELPAPLFLTTGAYDIALKRPDGSTVWTRQAVPSTDASSAVLTSLAAVGGAALIGNQRSFLNAIATTEHAWHESQVIDAVADCGMLAGGAAAANTLALQIAISASLVLGGAVEIPAGSYALTAGANFAANNLTILGRGRPEFDYSAGVGIGFKLDAGGAGQHLKSVRIENISFKGGPAITDIVYTRGIVSSVFRYLNAREASHSCFSLLFNVSNLWEKCTASADIQVMTTYPTYAFYMGNDGSAGADSSNVTILQCEGKSPGKTGLGIDNSTARCHVIGGAWESDGKAIEFLTDTTGWCQIAYIDGESNTSNDIVVRGKSHNFHSCFSNSAGSGNTVDIVSGTGATFTGGGYYRQINFVTGTFPSFIGISTDQTIGFSGTGYTARQYTRYGCTKVDGSGVTTGYWPDQYGPPLTAIPYVGSQGVTPAQTVTNAEAVVTNNVVDVQFRITFTAAGTAANGIFIDFPSAGLNIKGSALGRPVGHFEFTQGAVVRCGLLTAQSATEFSLFVDGANNFLGANPALTIAAGNTIDGTARYQLA